MTHPQEPRDEVAAATAALEATKQALEDDGTERQSWKTWVIVLLVLVLISNVGTAIGTINIISGRSASRGAQAAILSCTEPAGKCAQDSVRQQAAIIGMLVHDLQARTREDLIAVAKCRPGGVDEATLAACIDAMPPIPTLMPPASPAPTP